MLKTERKERSENVGKFIIYNYYISTIGIKTLGGKGFNCPTLEVTRKTLSIKQKIMAKICKHPDCNNNIWSRVSGYCKNHLYLFDKPKTKVKKARQKIKQVSSKRARENQAYTVLKRMYMEQHPDCEKCGSVATDLHHKALRGKYFLDSTTYASLCRPCHDWVHNNPKQAMEDGWLIKRNNK